MDHHSLTIDNKAEVRVVEAGVAIVVARRLGHLLATAAVKG